MARFPGLDFVQRDLVVAVDFDLRAKLAQALDEVVGEGIVVVDDQDHVPFPLVAVRKTQAMISRFTGDVKCDTAPPSARPRGPEGHDAATGCNQMRRICTTRPGAVHEENL